MAQKTLEDYAPDSGSFPKIMSPVKSPDGLPPAAFRDFRRGVLAWYRGHGRHDMPWRHTTDPYAILVSEVMLQQTQVARVTTKYPLFLAEFPDFTALVRAPLPAVLAAWQGMGYNRRAIALKKTATLVMEEYGGLLPDDPAVLATFPGIGQATASSIAAFTFNRPVVFIETNIRRVCLHWFFHGRETVPDREILPVAEAILDRKQPRRWYWALMDLGSAMKTALPNPNRRSAHYVRQAPFAGSDRRLRGMVLRLLLEEPGMDEEDLVGHLGTDRVRALAILAALESEGFIVQGSSGYLISDTGSRTS